MMNSYLVTLAEREAVRGAEAFAEALGMPLMAVLDADRTQRIIVQCCPLCLGSFLDEVLADPGLRLADPVVVHIDAHGAEHVPLLEPAGE